MVRWKASWQVIFCVWLYDMHWFSENAPPSSHRPKTRLGLGWLEIKSSVGVNVSVTGCWQLDSLHVPRHRIRDLMHVSTRWPKVCWSRPDGRFPPHSSRNLTRTDVSLLVSGESSRHLRQTPGWNPGTSVELSISVSECRQVPGRHHEMGTAPDHGAGQAARSTRRWGHLPWTITVMVPCWLHSPVTHSFIPVLGGCLTTLMLETLSSLGSSGANSPGLRGL